MDNNNNFPDLYEKLAKVRKTVRNLCYIVTALDVALSFAFCGIIGVAKQTGVADTTFLITWIGVTILVFALGIITAVLGER